MAKPQFIELDPVEAWREYTFPCGAKVKIEGVTKIAVSERGTHRLETEDGRKHIVNPGWVHIEIDVADWSL